MKQFFLHGLGQTPSSWDAVLRQLGCEETALCPDLAAMVSSEEATYGNLYRSVVGICKNLESPLNLCGLSLGAVLALHYAAEHPGKVNSLVLAAPQYKMPRVLLRVQNLLFRFMPSSLFQGTGFSKEQFIRLCASMESLDFTEMLSAIACPVLVVCGSRDRANLNACTRLARLLPRGELQILEGAGHELNQEVPEELARLIKNFYRTI